MQLLIIMFKLKILMLFLFLSTINGITPQECKKYSFMKENLKKRTGYEQKAKRLIRKELIQENIYDLFSANHLLKDADYFIIPQYKIKWNDTLDYTNEKIFLESLQRHERDPFSDVYVYKSEKLIGYYCCTDIGSYSMNLYLNQDYPDSFKRMIKSIERIKSRNYDFIFYVNGILHTWWLVKDCNVEVYFWSDRQFYDAQEFLNKFYTNDRIRKNANFQ